jgi:hypothetical protein
MFTILKPSHCRAGFVAGLGLLLASCASQAPRLSGTTSFALTSVNVDASAHEDGLAAALQTASLPPLNGARPASASVTIDVLRYDSAIIGLFYGGPDHASASVTLRDAGGAALERFTVHVAADEDNDAANGVLADKMIAIIAARAANAWPVMTSVPKATATPVAASAPAPAPAPLPTPSPAPSPAPAYEPPLVVAPEVDVSDAGAPCVIGADGRCIPL